MSFETISKIAFESFELLNSSLKLSNSESRTYCEHKCDDISSINVHHSRLKIKGLNLPRLNEINEISEFLKPKIKELARAIDQNCLDYYNTLTSQSLQLDELTPEQQQQVIDKVEMTFFFLECADNKPNCYGVSSKLAGLSMKVSIDCYDMNNDSVFSMFDVVYQTKERQVVYVVHSDDYEVARSLMA